MAATRRRRGGPGRRAWFWVEARLAGCTGVLAIVTLVSQEWIERVLGVDPDGGDGSLEWAIVAGLAIATMVFVVLARLEWRRSGRPQLTEPTL